MENYFHLFVFSIKFLCLHSICKWNGIQKCLSRENLMTFEIKSMEKKEKELFRSSGAGGWNGVIKWLFWKFMNLTMSPKFRALERFNLNPQNSHSMQIAMHFRFLKSFDAEVSHAIYASAVILIYNYR